MTMFVQFLIDVLSLGGAYALMALGLVIVFGILKLVNFAYGELIMVASAWDSDPVVPIRGHGFPNPGRFASRGVIA